MKDSIFLYTLRFFNIKEKLWLFFGSIADRIIKIMPQHIFEVRNFLELLKKEKYAVSENGNLLEVQQSNYQFLLRKGSSDIKVFQQIWVKEEFKHVVELIKRNHIKINTIVDAGANIGLTTIYLKQYFTEAKVICVEPDDTNYKQLQLHLDLNHIQFVDTVKGGIWSYNGWMDMDYSFRDGLEWSRSLKPAANKKGSIPVYAIGELVEKQGWDSIDLLKMDIEGAEETIFSAKENLSFLSNTKVITIEVHDMYGAGHKIMKALQTYKFEVYFSGELMIGIQNI